MSYQSDRDEFVGVIVAEVGQPTTTRTDNGVNERIAADAVALARLILRNAQTIQRHATDLCNREVTGREMTAALRAGDRIRAACEPWGIVPHFNGDPRGACVKLLLPSGRWNSWGGKEDGYCVPTR